MRKDLRQFFQAGNRVARRYHAAYAFQQMSIAPKPVYLFLSSEKGFVAFCRI